MAIQDISLTGSIQAKKGRLYAVMQYRMDGRRVMKWKSLGLPENASISKANKALREALNSYEVEVIKEIELKKRPESAIPVFEYMTKWFERAKKDLQINTQRSYRMMIYGKIRRYFEPKPEITLGSLTTRDINAFYDVLYRDGVLSNTVIHYHAVLRKAFQQAFREDIIDVNPFDKIEHPRKSKFKGDHYSEEELLALITLSKNDVIFPAIILAGCMGLRRSEAAGVRWSHIDFDNKTVLLDTKIVEVKNGDGTSTVIPVEEMKNKTSRRTLPLPEPVYNMLLDQYMKRERYKKMFGDSYNDKYEDYVCVTQLGDLLRPTYITNHFAGILKKHGMRKIRFHDLRHTFASILIKNDTQLIDVSNFLGHSDIATTVNIKNRHNTIFSSRSRLIVC